MQSISRKEFIQSSAILLTAMASGAAFSNKKPPLQLSFSTLGCPEWGFQQSIDFAAAHGYRGIELRGILKQLDLPQCPEFSSPQSITDTVARMKEKQLRFADLGSSCMLHFADPVKRKENLDGARRFIDLAQQISCPYVRVFPNVFPQRPGKTGYPGADS